MEIRVDVLEPGELPIYSTSNIDDEVCVPFMGPKIDIESLENALSALKRGEEEGASLGILVFSKRRDLKTGDTVICKVGSMAFTTESDQQK